MSDAVGEKSTEMDLIEYDSTTDRDDEMMETDDDCEPMKNERDVNLMDTDDESENEEELV